LHYSVLSNDQFGIGPVNECNDNDDEVYGKGFASCWLTLLESENLGIADCKNKLGAKIGFYKSFDLFLIQKKLLFYRFFHF